MSEFIALIGKKLGMTHIYDKNNICLLIMIYGLFLVSLLIYILSSVGYSSPFLLLYFYIVLNSYLTIL